jgi:hypothetical protein
MKIRDISQCLIARNVYILICYVVRTVHFGMKLYNDQRNVQVLINLSTYFSLTCFVLFFSPSSEAGVQLRQWFKSAGYDVSITCKIQRTRHSGTSQLLTFRPRTERVWVQISLNLLRQQAD